MMSPNIDYTTMCIISFFKKKMESIVSNKSGGTAFLKVDEKLIFIPRNSFYLEQP